AAIMSWTNPLIHAATTFFGLSGFTATIGSAASWMVQVPPGRKPSSQPASGLGKESSSGGPSAAASVIVGNVSNPASARPAKSAPNLFSAAPRETDWTTPLVSSSNLLFMTFLLVCFLGFVSGSNDCAVKPPGHPAR